MSRWLSRGLVAGITCLIAAPSARGHDPKPEIPSISVSGSASSTTLVDSIKVVFGIETDSATFGASKGQADAVFARIREHAARMALPEVQFRYDFLVLRQAGVSFGDRGAHMGHQLTIISEHIPPDALHASIIDLVDAALQTDKKVVVVSIKAHLSADRVAQIREALLTAASQMARQDAERIGASMKARVGRPLKVDREFSGDSIPRVAPPRGIEAIEVTGERFSSFVRKREDFELEKSFPSEVSYSAAVHASFELVP